MESGDSADRKLVRLAATHEDDMEGDYSTVAYFKTINDQVVFIMNRSGNTKMIIRILSQDQIAELAEGTSNNFVID